MKTKKRTDSWRFYIGWFNAIIIFLIPLVVHAKGIKIDDEIKWLQGNQSEIVDFFVYYKMVVLYIGAIVSFSLTLFFKLKSGWKFKFDFYTVILIAFSVSIMISTLLSVNKDIAIFGYPNRYEGMLTWFAYMLFSYSIYMYIEKKEDIYIFVRAIVYSSAVVSLIGVFQYLGYDYFNSGIGKTLMLSGEFSGLADQLVFNVQEGIVYSTLYNPNMIGVFVVLVVPMIYQLIKISKSNLEKALLGLLLIANIITLIGSKSTGGLIGMVVISILIIMNILYTKYKVKSVFLLLISLSIFSVLFAVDIKEKKSEVTSISREDSMLTSGFKSISIEENGLRIETNTDEILYINHDNVEITMKNRLLEEIDYSFTDGKHLILPEDMRDRWRAVFNPDTYSLHISFSDNEKWEKLKFYVVTDGFSIYSSKLESSDLEIQKYNIIKNESIFTNRGYIWNRTIPLILAKPYFGHGAEMFPLLFPQNDPISKSRLFRDQFIIVDKPHNIYLGVMTNFGMFGLIIFILLILKPIFNIKSQSAFITISLIGFMVTCVVYDSTIYTTSLVFILVGIQYKSHVLTKNSNLI